jgi:hypothetical protein
MVKQMFKINLYKDFESHRQAAKQGAMRRRMAVAMVIVAAVLTGTQVLSAYLMREQVSVLHAGLSSLERVKPAESIDNEQMAMARQMVQVRSARVDWTTKLSSIAQTKDDSFALTRIEGRSAVKNRSARFVITGKSNSGVVKLDVISEYVNKLRDDKGLNGDFPEVVLENIKSKTGEFEIRCGANGGSK